MGAGRPYYNPTLALTQTNKARNPASSALTSVVGGGRGAAGLSCREGNSLGWGEALTFLLRVLAPLCGDDLKAE